MQKINWDSRKYFLSLLLFTFLFINGCDVIESIFEAGVWVGVIVTLLVIALIAYIIIKIIQSIF